MILEKNMLVARFELATSAYHLSYFIRLLLFSQRAVVNAHKVYEHGVIARLNYTSLSCNGRKFTYALLRYKILLSLNKLKLKTIKII